MIIPLWSTTNTTVDSDIVEVQTGKAVALLATGLERFKVRQSSRTARDIQKICIGRIFYEYKEGTTTTVRAPAMNVCDCGFVYSCTEPGSIVEITEEIVQRNGSCWQLSACDNFRILVIPGLYRLHLNDDTAISKVQVYAEQYDIQDIPQQAAGLCFS